MLSQAVQHYWLWGVMLVIGLPLLVHVGQRRSSTFAGRLHALALRLPVLGDILAKSCVARYCRTLATTVGAGVPLVEGWKVLPAPREIAPSARPSIISGTTCWTASLFTSPCAIRKVFPHWRSR